MTDSEWNHTEQLFRDALALEPALREKFLAARRTEHPQRIARVAALLRAQQRVGTSLEAAIEAGASELFAQPIGGTSRVGEQLGVYRIDAKIGEGGASTVYSAKRTDEQFQRRVAIKILKRGMDTDEILWRFHVERQILATLEHPNIARILDGGTTADGLPYFVMEHIDGVPIDAYCDAHQLTLRARVELFVKVVSAVQYAHQHLVIHRDLKPANILVAADGVPKLLDFGIAKLLDPAVGEASGLEARTRHEFRLMSPAYASPEQFAGQPVAAASDVYSLGVVLYELLTGRRPAPSFHRVLAVKSEFPSAEPLRPSTAMTCVEERASTPPIGVATVTSARSSSVQQLVEQLRGDLDAIVLKALEPEFDRRYATAADLGEDLRRHLVNLPVTAAAPNAVYSLRKFVARHRRAVLAGVAFVVVLLASVVTTSALYLNAKSAERAAEQARNKMRGLVDTTLTEIYGLIEHLPGATEGRDRLMRKAKECLDALLEERPDDPQLLIRLAEAYVKLGDVEGNPSNARLGRAAAAVTSYEAALAVLARLEAITPRNSEVRARRADACDKIGEVLVVTESTDLALARFRTALELREQALAEDPGDATIRRGIVRSKSRLAFCAAQSGKSEEAVALYRAALDAATAVDSLQPADFDARRSVAALQMNLGTTLSQRAEHDEALSLLNQSSCSYELLREEAPQNFRILRELGICYGRMILAQSAAGQLDEALEWSDRAEAAIRRQIAADPKNVDAKRELSLHLRKIATILRDRNETSRALEHFAGAKAITVGLLDADPENGQTRRDLFLVQAGLAEALVRVARFESARAEYDEALRLGERLLAQDESNASYRLGQADVEVGLAGLLACLGDTHAASAVLKSAQARYADLSAQSPGDASLKSKLAACAASLAAAESAQKSSN